MLDAVDGHVHCLQAVSDDAADAAETNDGGCFSVDLVKTAKSFPLFGFLIVVCSQESSRPAEYHAEHMLGDGDAVDTAHVRKQNVGRAKRFQRDKAIDPRRQCLHPAKLRRIRQYGREVRLTKRKQDFGIGKARFTV